MSSRERVAQRGSRKGIAAKDRFTTELREARLNLGRSQELVAAQAGIHRSEWSRIEAGRRSSIPWELAGRMAAVVGLDFTVQLYASEVRVRDAAQIGLMRRLRREPGPAWTWRYEVPLGEPSDQRAWDAGATHAGTGLSIRVDAETRLRDCQSLMRRIEAKRLSDGEPRVILLLSATHHNRASVRSSADWPERAPAAPSGHRRAARWPERAPAAPSGHRRAARWPERATAAPSATLSCHPGQ